MKGKRCSLPMVAPRHRMVVAEEVWLKADDVPVAGDEEIRGHGKGRMSPRRRTNFAAREACER